MIHPSIKKCLRFPEDMPDATLLRKWRARTRVVCKPCWELKYCPYGPVVEDFPLLPLTKAYYRKQKVETRKMLSSGRLWNGQRLQKGQRAQLLKHLDDPIPNDIPDALPRAVAESCCAIFGHVCPVFFVAEPFTETKDGRRIGRYIRFDVRMRVARRDNYTCQACGKHLKDDDLEFDHAIPVARGGSSDEHNVRLTCFACNRKKATKVHLRLVNAFGAPIEEQR